MSTQATETSTPPESGMGSKEQEIYQQRLEKGRRWKESGFDPYGNAHRPEHRIEQVHAKHADDDDAKLQERGPHRYAVAGRMVMRNNFGKAAFIKLRDGTGELQVHVKKDLLGDEAFELFKSGADLGDFFLAEGNLFRSRTGELTLAAERFVPLTKSLRPMPEKWHGLQDVETRYRQRYLDLMGNPEVKEVFLRRNKLIRYIRSFLDARDFLEVETPMMHPLVSGAAARPFLTHHNALDIPLFMRIAPELYLKRLVVGGLERVYEINRNFRNEGVSTRHNPEFTMLEFYQAYATYEDLMDLTEEMLSGAAEAVTGSKQVTYQGTVLDFGAPFKRVAMRDAVREKLPSLSPEDFRNAEALRPHALEGTSGEERRTIETLDAGELTAVLFERLVEEELQQPTFVTHFPTSVSPLARRNDQDPELTDRFELYVGGREIANAFSELNDPLDQKQRFQAQVEAKARGQAETMDYDEDYIRALEHGMPPTAGEGIGIDRLAMIFTDAPSIRDVILFPLLKPQAR
ncbi:MAG TPA: lysine--tRNA ligase [Myxococcaceae bacterium]|nr:lysine--tRNA ligase [Myxococcaceae bacterium]